jgi:hypothetical protein
MQSAISVDARGRRNAHKMEKRFLESVRVFLLIEPTLKSHPKHRNLT